MPAAKLLPPHTFFLPSTIPGSKRAESNKRPFSGHSIWFYEREKKKYIT